MIIWFTGNTGSGKTTAAKKFIEGSKDAVHLDGDVLRSVWPVPVEHDTRSRCINTLAIAKLASTIEKQGMVVVVSAIAPYESLRAEVDKICGHPCKWIHMDNNQHVGDPDRPYEDPINPVMRIKWQKLKD
jgi:adenylylsulfate kinase-like enzyme